MAAEPHRRLTCKGAGQRGPTSRLKAFHAPPDVGSCEVAAPEVLTVEVLATDVSLAELRPVR